MRQDRNIVLNLSLEFIGSLHARFNDAGGAEVRRAIEEKEVIYDRLVILTDWTEVS